jgi:hypothetical protein
VRGLFVLFLELVGFLGIHEKQGIGNREWGIGNRRQERGDGRRDDGRQETGRQETGRQETGRGYGLQVAGGSEPVTDV